MPPESIWLQFSIVAVLVLSTTLIARAFFLLWHELMTWQAKQEALRAAERKEQDEKRDLERETQRKWEAEQSQQRDQQWQSFLRTMQEQWVANDRRNSAVLEKLVEQINELTVSVNNHDTFVRASGGADRPPARRKS
jgi:hypothetical protein